MDEEARGKQVIEFFTALLIDYTLQGNKMRTTVWFETERHCQEVMDRNIAEPLYNYLYALYGNDMMMTCYVSEEVSPLYNYLYALYGNDMMMTCYVSEEVSHDLVRPKLRPKSFE